MQVALTGWRMECRRPSLQVQLIGSCWLRGWRQETQECIFREVHKKCIYVAVVGRKNATGLSIFPPTRPLAHSLTHPPSHLVNPQCCASLCAAGGVEKFRWKIMFAVYWDWHAPNQVRTCILKKVASGCYTCLTFSYFPVTEKMSIRSMQTRRNC